MSEATTRILVYAALLILTLCGAFIRIYGIGEWMYSPDDVLHLSYGIAPTALKTFHIALYHNTHSPGFFVILHYMLKISHNDLFLRSIGIVPGIALIPSFYALGNIYKGRAAGLFMAFIATFSIELIGVSEGIRQYSLLLFLESWALYSLLRYDKTGKFGYLIGYGLLSLISIHMHYTCVIFIMACGIVWFSAMVSKEKNRQDIIGWVLIHMVLAAMFLVLFILKYQTDTLHADLSYAINDFAVRGFSSDVDRLVAIIFYLLFFNHYMFDIRLTAPLLFLITTAGYIIIIEKKEYKILGLIGMALLVNAILTLAKLYPILEGRDCIYVLPLVLLPPAFAVQFGVDYINDTNHHHRLSAEKKQWLAFLPMVCFIGSVGYGLIDASNKSYYRNVYGSNFAMTKQKYAEILDYIFSATKKGDIIITERCFVDYLFYENGGRHDDKVIGRIHHLTYKGRELYYTDSTSADILFWHISDLQDFLQQLSTIVPAVQHQPLWFFSAGWPSIYNKFLNDKMYYGSMDGKSKRAIAIATLAHEFVHSDQVSHRISTPEGLGTESGFVTNWQFLEKTLLSKEMVEVFHQKKPGT